MKAGNKKRSFPGIILTGMLFGLLASAAVIAVCAWIVTKKDMSFSRLPIMVLLACAFGSMICAFANAKRIKMRGIVSGLFSAGILTAIYLILLFVISGFSLSGWLAAILAVDLILGGISGILAKNIG